MASDGNAVNGKTVVAVEFWGIGSLEPATGHSSQPPPPQWAAVDVRVGRPLVSGKWRVLGRQPSPRPG